MDMKRDNDKPTGWSLQIIHLHHPCELKINQQTNKVSDLGAYYYYATSN
jgi:hypothetical protein